MDDDTTPSPQTAFWDVTREFDTYVYHGLSAGYYVYWGA